MTLTELKNLGHTLNRRAADILAYFDRPGTSNGPTEAIQRSPGTPTRHRPGLPKSDQLHRPNPTGHRRLQTPATPSAMSHHEQVTVQVEQDRRKLLRNSVVTTYIVCHNNSVSPGRNDPLGTEQIRLGMSKEKSPSETIILGLGSIPFVFIVVWIFSSFFESQSGSITWASFRVALTMAVIGFIFSIALAIFQFFNNINIRKIQQKESAESHLKELRDKHAAQKDSLVNALRRNYHDALLAFRSMPEALNNAEGWTRQAAFHYNDGAFSPFWSDIEQAYLCLNHYRISLDAVAAAARRHPLLVSQLIDFDINPGRNCSFLIDLDIKRILRVLESATSQLEAMTYHAQKHEVFAKIWEQRRTTTAVVEGFSNLETAVRSMGRAISKSLTDMGDAILESNESVEKSVRGVGSALRSFDDNNNRAMNDLITQVNEAKQELHYQNWGHYRLFS